MELIKSRTFTYIDLEAARHNYRAVTHCVGQDTKMMPVIKADGYGHGAVRLARLYTELGAYALCVACISEALELRQSGITSKILILGPTLPQYAEVLCEYDIMQTVHSLAYAEALCESIPHTKRLKVHIKLDTGMRRIGFTADDAPEKLVGMKKLEVCGIFTHFAESDAPQSDFTARQLELYGKILTRFEDSTILRHTSNSAACLCHSNTHFDAVRPGIILYGCYPSDEVKESYESVCEPLKPVMSFRSHITHIFNVKKGESIGYSRTFFAPHDMRIATVCAGYADGVPRKLSNKGKIGINGRLCNIVGNVCMDQLMVDVTDAEVSLYDEAVIFGIGGDSCDNVAKQCGTINYEIYCGITSRVTRIYVGE